MPQSHFAGFLGNSWHRVGLTHKRSLGQVAMRAVVGIGWEDLLGKRGLSSDGVDEVCKVVAKLVVSADAVCYKPNCDTGNPVKIGRGVLAKATPKKPFLYRRIPSHPPPLLPRRLLTPFRFGSAESAESAE